MAVLELLDDEAGLDGLAQAHLVGDEEALVQGAHDPVGAFHLVREDPGAGIGKGQDLVVRIGELEEQASALRAKRPPGYVAGGHQGKDLILTRDPGGAGAGIPFGGSKIKQSRLVGGGILSLQFRIHGVYLSSGNETKRHNANGSRINQVIF